MTVKNLNNKLCLLFLLLNSLEAIIIKKGQHHSNKQSAHNRLLNKWQEAADSPTGQSLYSVGQVFISFLASFMAFILISQYIDSQKRRLILIADSQRTSKKKLRRLYTKNLILLNNRFKLRKLKDLKNKKKMSHYYGSVNKLTRKLFDISMNKDFFYNEYPRISEYITKRKHPLSNTNQIFFNRYYQTLKSYIQEYHHIDIGDSRDFVRNATTNIIKAFPDYIND